MYKEKGACSYLEHFWWLILLLHTGFLSLPSYSGVQPIVNEAFEVQLFNRDRSGRIVHPPAIPSVGTVQIDIHTSDYTGEVTEIEKHTSGQFMVLIDRAVVTLSFGSKTRFIKTGEVVLDTWFINRAPSRPSVASNRRLNPESIYREGRLHFWNHIIPSSFLFVRIVVSERNIITTVIVNDVKGVFKRSLDSGDFCSARQQALGREVINAVLSHNPPETFQGINPMHGLNHYFTYTRLPDDHQIPFNSLETSGVTYSYPLYVANLERGEDGGQSINARYTRTDRDLYIYGTERVQVHRFPSGSRANELTPGRIHHPAYLLTLLMSNAPTLAEVAEETYFLNLNSIRSYPGVEALLARHSLLEEGERGGLPLDSPVSGQERKDTTEELIVPESSGGNARSLLQGQERLPQPSPPEPAEAEGGAPFSAISSGSTTVFSGLDVPMLTAMAMASENEEATGVFQVNLGVDFSSSGWRGERGSGLSAAVELTYPRRQFLPMEAGGSPQPPVPVPFSYGAAGGVQTPQWPRADTGYMGFGFLDDDEVKKK